MRLCVFLLVLLLLFCYSLDIRTYDSHTLDLTVVHKHARILHHLRILCDRRELPGFDSLVVLVRRVAHLGVLMDRFVQVGCLVELSMDVTLLLEAIKSLGSLV